MVGANYMGGRRNAAKARVNDSDGRLQRSYFGKQRLLVLSKGLATSATDRKKAHGHGHDIALAHARRRTEGSFVPFDNANQQTSAYAPMTPPSKRRKITSTDVAPSSNSTAGSRSSRIMNEMNTTEPLFMRAEIERLLSHPDFAGLSQRPKTPVKYHKQDDYTGAESFRSPSYNEDFSSPSVSSPLRRRNTSILVPSPRSSFASSSSHAELMNNATRNFRKDGEEHAFSGLRCVNDVSSPPELGRFRRYSPLFEPVNFSPNEPSSPYAVDGASSVPESETGSSYQEVLDQAHFCFGSSDDTAYSSQTNYQACYSGGDDNSGVETKFSFLDATSLSGGGGRHVLYNKVEEDQQNTAAFGSSHFYTPAGRSSTPFDHTQLSSGFSGSTFGSSSPSPSFCSRTRHDSTFLGYHSATSALEYENKCTESAQDSSIQETLFDAVNGQLFEDSDPWTAIKLRLNLLPSLDGSTIQSSDGSDHSDVLWELALANDRSGVGYIATSTFRDTSTPNVAEHTTITRRDSGPLEDVIHDTIQHFQLPSEPTSAPLCGKIPSSPLSGEPLQPHSRPVSLYGSRSINSFQMENHDNVEATQPRSKPQMQLPAPVPVVRSPIFTHQTEATVGSCQPCEQPELGPPSASQEPTGSSIAGPSLFGDYTELDEEV